MAHLLQGVLVYRVEDPIHMVQGVPSRKCVVYLDKPLRGDFRLYLPLFGQTIEV